MFGLKMMPSLQTWCILPIAAALFLPIAPTLAEVVSSLSDCDHFLLGETPPRVPGVLEGGRILNQNRYKPICQTYRNKRRFVTLYDVRSRIPVFSAYKYTGEKDRGRPKKNWKVEPQLENELANKTMMTRDKRQTYSHQAVDTDFKSNGTFDRGHIFPSSHGFTSNDKRSTFTLTNIVPQAGSFNKGSWSRMERCIKCVMDKYCINSSGVTEGFVVTGAQPSANNILNNRINIPTVLWSAFCCYSFNMKTWIASAHWGDNVPDGSRRKYLQTKTLAELQAELDFNVFPGATCPVNTTVSRFYPEIKNCDCLPPTSNTSDPNPSTSTPNPSTSTPNPSTSTPNPSASDPNSSSTRNTP